MTSAATRLSRVSAAAAIAFALAAAPAGAAGFLKLGNVDGDTQGRGGQIEIESFHWGPRQSTSADGSRPGTAIGGAIGGWANDGSEAAAARPGSAKSGTAGDPDRPIVAGRIPNAGIEREMKESGEKGGTEDINIGVGELQETSGRRTHKPVKIVKEWDSSTPMLRQGSVTTLVPAGTCRLGARYPTAELGTGQRVYRMTNVVVAGCMAGSGGSSEMRPMESMSLNYERIVWK